MGSKLHSSAEMFHLFCRLSCALLLISQSQGVRDVERQGHAALENVVLFYGGNASISQENLSDLLLIISARRSESVTENGNPLATQEVSSVSALWDVLNEPRRI